MKKLIGQLLGVAGRLYPFRRGKNRFFRVLCKNGPLKQYLAALDNPVSMKGGFSIHTYADDFISQWMRLYGEYEIKTLKTIDRVLPRGAALLDAGANLGVISLGLARRRPDVSICCVEPNPQTIDLLRASIRENGWEGRIRVFPVGLSHRSGELDFFHDSENTGASCLVGEGGEAMAGKSIKVPVVRLDEHAEFQNHIKEGDVRIGCLKMDIQGAEFMALKGMEQTIRAHRPVLLVEMDDKCLKQFGSSEQELRRLIADLGYEIVDEFEGNVLAECRRPGDGPVDESSARAGCKA